MNKRSKQRKPAWQRYLPVIYLVVLGGGAMLIFAWLGPVFSEPTETTVSPSTVTAGSFNTANNRTSNEDYVRLAEQADAELLEKLRRKKESRSANGGRDESVRHYENALAEKQERFEQFAKSVDDERSVAYGLKQEIEAMKKDDPTLAE